MKLPMKPLLFVLCMTGGLALFSCSSSPSDEEMKALDNLKDQAAQLDRNVKDLQREKAGLEQQIADKNAKLQQCQSDHEAVKKALGK